MKIVVGIATYKRDKYLAKTLESLEGQADDIRVYDNKKEKKDYKANAKFIFLNDYSEPIYYFTCDDDIIYPSNYIRTTISAIKKYDSIISYHGDVLLESLNGQYPKCNRYHFNRSISTPKKIHVAGTALTAFDTRYFNPKDIYKDQRKNMIDHIFSLQAAQEYKKIVLPPHKGNIFIDQGVPSKKTIWGKYKNTRPEQIDLANEILWIKNGKK